MIKTTKAVKGWILFFMISLFLSGLTAIPIESELAFFSRLFPSVNGFGIWIEKVYLGVADTNARYPFIAYGYDWLAFAHFVLAILFVGPYKNPVRNRWVIEFGMVACLLIIPFAFIAGYYRGIPLYWRLIDCSFGVIGLIPLIICVRKINHLELLQTEEAKLDRGMEISI